MVVVAPPASSPRSAVDAIALLAQQRPQTRSWRSRASYPGRCRRRLALRSRVWPCDLQQKLCNRNGLRVSVCHYPPGASKWNPIEHRLFSEISKNWQGVPLETYDTVLNYISTIRASARLIVAAKLNSKPYHKGQEVTDEEMQLLSIRRHRTLQEWNYSIKPYDQNRLRKM